MSLSLGVLLGIVTMLCWGASDFVAANSSRKIGATRTFFWSQAIVTIFYSLAFAAFFKLPLLSLETLALITFAGLFNALGFLVFYKAFQLGKIAIVSPITNTWAVFTIVMALAFLGESLTAVQAFGALLAILGSVLVSFKLHDLYNLDLSRKNVALGAEYALIAALLFGSFYTVLDVLASRLDWFFPMFLVRFPTLALVFLASAAIKKKLDFPSNALGLVALVGLLETIGNLSYGAGITLEFSAVMAPIAATMPLVTILLAVVLLKESLEVNQKVGIASIVSGIVLLSV
ncbi:MAG TPA: DMT family transporter [archaeon]|nr:DMT family transporter [archaeon]